MKSDGLHRFSLAKTRRGEPSPPPSYRVIHVCGEEKEEKKKRRIKSGPDVAADAIRRWIITLSMHELLHYIHRSGSQGEASLHQRCEQASKPTAGPIPSPLFRSSLDNI